MKNEKIFFKNGFSLAEALISLLIVCLITIASIPVLTKKKRVETKVPRGKYICTVENNGVHKYSEDNGATWKDSGANCIFAPPRAARNFALTLVGGGGGGSSANSSGIKSYEGTRDFTPEPGVWNFIAIGGGGNGGWVNVNREFYPFEIIHGASTTGVNNPTRCWGGGGGLGGAATLTYTVPSDNYRIDLYQGTVQPYFSVNPNDWGNTGKSSTVKLVDKDGKINNLLVANGGGGGQNNINNCGEPPGGAQGGTSGISGYTPYVSSLGRGASDCGNIENNLRYDCQGRFDSSTVSKINSFIGSSLISTAYNTNYIGQGGVPRNIVYSTTYGSGERQYVYGGPGYVKAWAKINKSGKGGEAAIPVQKFMPSIEKALIITVGRSGTSNTNGGDTVITNEDYFAFGAKSSTLGGREAAEKNIPGGSGEKSRSSAAISEPLGGLQAGNASIHGLSGIGYGAGGGGGAVSTTGSYTQYGNGAIGTPGAVIIEW